MIDELFEVLGQKSLKLAAAESLTGGLFAASVTAVPGASKVFAGATVTYGNEAKIALGVNRATIEKFGAVSKETAREMALSAGRFYGAEVVCSFTGNAGPDVLEDKKVGEVYIGILIRDQITVYRLQLDGDRQKIREQCVNFAIKTLVEKLRSV